MHILKQNLCLMTTDNGGEILGVGVPLIMQVTITPDRMSIFMWYQNCYNNQWCSGRDRSDNPHNGVIYQISYRNENLLSSSYHYHMLQRRKSLCHADKRHTCVLRPLNDRLSTSCPQYPWTTRICREWATITTEFHSLSFGFFRQLNEMLRVIPNVTKTFFLSTEYLWLTACCLSVCLRNSPTRAVWSITTTTHRCCQGSWFHITVLSIQRTCKRNARQHMVPLYSMAHIPYGMFRLLCCPSWILWFVYISSFSLISFNGLSFGLASFPLLKVNICVFPLLDLAVMGSDSQDAVDTVRVGVFPRS